MNVFIPIGPLAIPLNALLVLIATCLALWTAAQAYVEQMGVEHKVAFLQHDLFDVDVSPATRERVSTGRDCPPSAVALAVDPSW